jgi:hypothetical protein
VKISRKWPTETPFDFEKSHKDTHWLPIRCGVSKEELFVSIDDDHGEPGSSLISRGLYPNRVPRAIVGIAGGCTAQTEINAPTLVRRLVGKIKRALKKRN